MLTERQYNILKIILDIYSESATPVSSQMIAEALDYSPATIRNEMTVLADLGFVISPHTSAGRIPTKSAYRWFCDTLDKPDINDLYTSQKESVLKKEELKRWNEFSNEIKDLPLEHKVKLVAKALSNCGQCAVATICNSENYYYTGLQALAGQPEFTDVEFAKAMALVIDQLDQALTKFSKDSKEIYEPYRVFLGTEFFTHDYFGMIVISLSEKNRLVILGPIRQQYHKQIERVLRSKLLLT